MGSHDTQQVCLNGHQMTANYHRSPNFRRKFCSTCREETIYRCSICNAKIPGEYHTEGVVIGVSTPVPTHCENCGTAFPWANKKNELAAQADGSKNIDHFKLVEQICTRFHLIDKQLRTRYNKRNTLIVEDEYDTQDLLHSLLHLYFDDILPEKWTSSYAGGCSRVDFLLKEEQIIIEVKKTRKTLKAKDVGEQLIVDSQRYRTHSDCRKLLCFVYDPEGWISITAVVLKMI